MAKQITMEDPRDTDELGDFLSDFHKAVWGFRCMIDIQNRALVVAKINELFNYFEHVQKTFQGREELREQGWVIEETEPELILLAKQKEEARNAAFSWGQ